ncbi:MutS-related protein [Sphingobacterium sp. LRF_L2]|uniref:MutS-related protein n=1 Tax=Sphingobacterium sp. LRF_L2 TaxID=3369421 RepID=UPI003F6300EA
MSFITDKQTLRDLNILGKYRRDSIFSLFNQTSTFGGEHLLEDMFHNPLTQLSEIQKRSAIIAFFRKHALPFNIDLDDLELGQNFINSDTNRSYSASLFSIARYAILEKMGLSAEKKHFEASARALLRLMLSLRRYLQQLDGVDHQNLLQETPLGQRWIREANELQQLQEEVEKSTDSLSWQTAAKCDYYLRYTWAEELQDALKMIYYIDVYQSIAQVANLRNFVAAVPYPTELQKISLENVYHPTIPRAIGNDIHFNKEENLLFLTGANMAGKSTYMKSLGIALYLAHMGFPVPANAMHFSIKDGLYSSINVEDNIDLGHSHYYAEVLRVKQIAEAVNEGKNLVVIFDELFKGTNVKDAFEATLAVTRAFQQHHSCQYLISTHIVEVGEKLKEEIPQVQFLYMPTIMRGQVPHYTYKSEKGISADKHGMVLIQKENVLELLENSRTKF